MILEKNKEIQYMNMRSIVLEISAENSLQSSISYIEFRLLSTKL